MPDSINARYLVGLCFCLLLTSGVSLACNHPGPLPIEEVLRVRDFVDGSPPAISPDGKWLAYAVREPSTQTARERANSHPAAPVSGYHSNIYVEDIEGGKTQTLTRDQGNNWLPVWSPNGRYLAFLSDQGTKNEPRLWIWDSIGHQFKLACDLEAQTDQIEWTPDSESLLITVASKEQLNGNNVRVRSLLKQAEGAPGPGGPSASVLVYSSSGAISISSELAKDGPWDLDERRRDLAFVDIQRATAKILVHAKRISTFLLSPDGSSVAYTSPVRFESPGSQQILFSFAIVRISTGEERHIGIQFRLDYDGAEFSWSPDGALMAVQTGGMDEAHSDCYVLTRDSTVRNITIFPEQARKQTKASAPLWDEKGNVYLIHDGELWRTSAEKGKADEIGWVPNHDIVRLIPKADSRLWIASEKSAIVVTHDTVRKQDGFFSIDLDTGGSRKLLEKGECYTCTNLANQFTVMERSAELLYFAEDAAHHSDLWIAQSDFTSSRRLTGLNGRLDEYQMGTPRLIEWLSDDGIALQGALMLPPGFRPGVRYPLLVWVYGGASASEQIDRFGLGYSGPLNLQLLATRGYAVLLPDIPLEVGTPILDLTKIVLPAINEVVRMGIADPEKLGVLGHSYGGYSTIALITQTSRFQAAVELSGYADLVGHYGEMDRSGAAFGIAIDERGQGRMGGSPWEFPGRYIQNSPIFFLDHVNTPLLMVHGSADTTIPSFLGDELFVALRRLGKNVEYAKYEGEGHIPSSWTFPNQTDLCNRILSWFDLLLKGRIRSPDA
jgi:dipeptidyl aminopeptidase/acylaminoacyl peptidase